MLKCVGISGSLHIDDNGLFGSNEYSYSNKDYIDAVLKLGLMPVILPICKDEKIIAEQIKKVDAIILQGGHDVNPLLFNEEPKRNLGKTLKDRDFYDLKLIEFAIRNNKPILGICRGLQILNVYFGGSLYQDINENEDFDIKHLQEEPTYEPTHSVFSKKGSLMKKKIGDKFLVNSFHHMAIKDIAKNFKIAAVSKDGIIEAIEDADNKILAVQWHPEMLIKNSSKMIKIFEHLKDEYYN
ncbi:gamma-glutamyl-gamma-aminobutyrate hydrolase family protein [Peptostreptococcaceae bacterium AGR-M142]